jgi:hypothetical protein
MEANDMAGWTANGAITSGPGAGALITKIGNVLVRPFLSQSAADGELPVLFAATSPEATRPGPR